ncbi:MAG TPA: tetratricopeptide repeat protein, partial [Cyclobacteriaceae bacterium]|nr:tetratricopeptide repeat protein [Cyclobacteriaceae bacterium]
MVRETLLLLLFIGFSTTVHAQIPVNEKKGSSFMYYYLEGEKLLEEKKYDEALANFNEALNLYPYHADSYYSRAGILEKRGDVDGALRDYTIYLELKPDQFDALFSRALLLLSLEKWELAK